ncbi:hypothetical protein HAX54_044791, partial [Datura stramonium]|nr:hypothetical protein [Datura stramonium]
MARVRGEYPHEQMSGRRYHADTLYRFLESPADCDRDQYKYVTIRIWLCDRDQYSVGKWRMPVKLNYFLEQYRCSGGIPTPARPRQLYRCSVAQSKR